MLKWVLYAHNSIFLASLRTVRWTHSYFAGEESEGRSFATVPGQWLHIGSQQPLAPGPTWHRQCLRTQPWSSSRDHDPPSPARGKTFTKQGSAWLLKTICLFFLFPFFFIKSISQPDLFYAISCWLSSLATYSVCLPNFPQCSPICCFPATNEVGLVALSVSVWNFPSRERSGLRGGWWQWSTESRIRARLLAPPGALMTSASPSKTRAQQASTDAMDTSP